MRNKVALILVMLGMLTAVLTVPAVTAPQPNPGKGSWELDINYSAPKPILVKVPGEAHPQLFWYFRYTVTNRTGEEQMFAPEIVLSTDTGQILKAGQGVNPAVFKAIKKAENSTLLQDQFSITGKLLQGQDNAKDGVAIFRNFDPKAGKFDLFFSGLSGENALVKLPTPIKVKEIGIDGKERVVTKTTILLTKTLKLSYVVGTEASDRLNAQPKFISKSWVMR